MKKAFAVFLTFLLSCSPVKTGSPIVPRVDSAEIIYSRTSLSGTEFEHYKLTPPLLYYECGTIRRSTPNIDQQDVLTLPAEAYEDLAAKVADILSYKTDKNETLPPAGDNSAFSDPGKFSLNISGDTSLDVKGSFDSVSSRQGALAEKLFQLVRAVRSTAAESRKAPPCSNAYFFGIPSSLPGTEG